MFGENQIIGKENIKINSKNEIKLPLFTFAEEKDNLVVLKDKNSYILINSLDYFNLIKKYELGKKDARNYKEYKNIIRKLYSKIIGTAKCDKDLKITLPTEIKEKSLHCIGGNKHLILRKVNRG